MPPDYDKLGINVDELYKQARAIAARRLSRIPNLWVTPADLAHDALLHLHEHWNPDRCSAYNYIYLRIVHEIDDLLNRASTRSIKFMPPENVVEFPDPRPSTEQLALYAIQEQELYTHIECIHPESRILAEWILRSG